MALYRISHTGAAPVTGVAVGFSSGATTFTVNNGNGYPDGTVGPFVIKVDAGTASEEKILCSSRSSNTFTVSSSPAGRGFDGTSATSHGTGATNVEHDCSAIEIDDVNDHVYTTTRDDHTQYAKTDGSRNITGAALFNSTVGVNGVLTAGSITTGGAITALGKVTANGGAVPVNLQSSTQLYVQVGSYTQTILSGNSFVTGTFSFPFSFPNACDHVSLNVETATHNYAACASSYATGSFESLLFTTNAGTVGSNVTWTISYVAWGH